MTGHIVTFLVGGTQFIHKCIRMYVYVEALLGNLLRTVIWKTEMKRGQHY